jgi:hypothetical protein
LAERALDQSRLSAVFPAAIKALSLTIGLTPIVTMAAARRNSMLLTLRLSVRLGSAGVCQSGQQLAHGDNAHTQCANHRSSMSNEVPAPEKVASHYLEWHDWRYAAVLWERVVATRGISGE